MKLCMNLNLWAWKQNYYLTSLNYVVVTIVFSVSCIKQTNYFFRRIFHISFIYYLLSQRFLYLMTVKLPEVRNNHFEEMNRQWNCIVSKHVLSTNFYGNKKEEQRNFSMVKEYRRQEFSIIQVLIFVPVCVAVFLTSIFLF